MLRTLIISIITIGFSSLAHSDNSWVLWLEQETYSEPDQTKWNRITHEWHIIDAFEELQNCKVSQKNSIEGNSQTQSDEYDIMYIVKENIVSLSYFPKNANKTTDVVQRAVVSKFICLPSEIDPRK